MSISRRPTNHLGQFLNQSVDLDVTFVRLQHNILVWLKFNVVLEGLEIAKFGF